MNARRLTVRELVEGKGQVSPHIYAEECPILLRCTEAEAALIFRAVRRWPRKECERIQITETMQGLVR